MDSPTLMDLQIHRSSYLPLSLSFTHTLSLLLRTVRSKNLPCRRIRIGRARDSGIHENVCPLFQALFHFPVPFLFRLHFSSTLPPDNVQRRIEQRPVICPDVIRCSLNAIYKLSLKSIEPEAIIALKAIMWRLTAIGRWVLISQPNIRRRHL